MPSQTNLVDLKDLEAPTGLLDLFVDYVCLLTFIWFNNLFWLALVSPFFFDLT